MSLTVVIGSNRGIGLEITRQLADQGATVLATCRRTNADLGTLDVEVSEGVDVGSDAGIAALVAAVGDRQVSALWVIAGILRHVSLDDLDLGLDSIREQFEINALGPLRAVNALRERLTKGSKVGLLTSRMGSIADNDSGGHYGYRMSKAALNMAGKSLALDLASAGVSVALLHPGYVRTDMTGGQGLIDSDESAAGLIARLDELTPETSGGFWHTSGEVLPW